MQDKALPFGLRDVKLTPLGVDGATPGTPVDLPVSRTLSFSETEEFEELRGDDTVAASHGGGPIVEWSLESGGISLEAYAVMAGGTVLVSGSTPNEVKTYRKLETDARPYFRIEGQSINDNGGDFHCVIYRAKADGSLEGEMGNGSFWLTSASGKGYGSLVSGHEGRSYDFVQNESTTALAGSEQDEVQQVIVDATGGTFTLTYDGQTTGAIAYNASASAVLSALEALSNIAPGDVTVVGDAGGPYTVTFTGTLAGTNVTQMVADSTALTGGSAAAVVMTARQGS